MRPLVPVALVLAVSAALPACSSTSQDPRPASSTGAESSADVARAAPRLAVSGFTVQNGRFAFLDMSSCCSTSCLGNNPSSPYAGFYVPPAPGYPPEPEAGPDGLADVFHFREDEAIVFIGTTPPESRYFGFTPYLNDHAKLDGSRRLVAASLSETLNDLVIAVDAPAGSSVFGQRTAIVAAADATTQSKVIAGLVASGIPASAINSIVFDPALSRFGLGAAADRFSVLFRVALPTDKAQLDAYIANPPAAVYRLTPTLPRIANKLPSPQPRPKDLSNSEVPLTSSVDALQAAITASYPGWTADALSVDDGVPDPVACIDGTAECAYDNRDTTYPATNPRKLFVTDDDFYVVFGVDHQISGKVSYANASVYGMEHLVGLKSVASDEYPGSAQRYLSTADASKLYAWKIARSCNGEPFCMEIPAGACPTGIDDGALGAIAFRTYLEPTSKTAPDPSTLVRDRVLRFHH